MLIEFISTKFADLTIFLVYWLVFKKIKKKALWEPQYDVIVTVINTLIFNVQIYMMIPLFPAVVVISPLLQLANFKWEMLKIRKMYAKPNKTTLDDVNF